MRTYWFGLVVQPNRLVALRPPPVADKGSKALPEITSNRKYIYVQRIATIFQTGEHGSPLQTTHCFHYIKSYVFEQNVSSKRATDDRHYSKTINLI